MKLTKAIDLTGVLQSLTIRPLTQPELPEFYIDTKAGRGDNPVSSILRLLNADPNGRKHILFSGYRGCGKTTELNNLSRNIGEDLLILNFSIYKELDPNTISHIDLYIALTEQLLQLVERKGLRINSSYYKKLKLWTEIEEIKKITTTSGELSAEFDVGGGSPEILSYFIDFFVKLKGKSKIGGAYKKEITEKIEPTLTELIENCNLLIGEIKIKTNKGLLIIIEDLDKLDLPKANHLFYNYSPQLTQIDANVIFTFPISLMYHSRFTIIRSHYQDNFELPMIKVFNKDGTPNKEGRSKLKEIVGSRMDLQLIEEGLLDSFMAKSGGCIGDLFRMIQTAALKALDYDKKIIEREDYCKAYWRLRKDYENSIAEKKTSEEWIKEEEYVQTLVDTYESKDHKPPNNKAALDLRQNLCILSYNDTQWYAIHPLVQDYLIEKGKIRFNGEDPHKCT